MQGPAPASQDHAGPGHRPTRETAGALEARESWAPAPGLALGPVHAPPGVRTRDVVRLQRLAGNAAVSRRMARPVQVSAAPPAVAGPVIRREVVKIGGGERLEVDDNLSTDDRKKLIKEAQALIAEIKSTYGVTISSTASVKAILKDYFPGKKAPKEIREAIQPAPWRLDELKNVRSALNNYGPLLGKLRKQAKDPAVAGSKQNVTTIGKVGKALSPDDSGPHGVEVETSTLGETFKSSKNVAFFEALSTADKNFRGDNPAQQRGTTSHELCHSLVEPQYLASFVSTFKDYWQDSRTRIADRGRKSTADPPAEAPISYYGGTNAGEDLAETSKFYFEAPGRLKGGDGAPKGTPGNPAPRRYDFFHRIVLSWTQSPKQVVKTRFQELASDFLSFSSTSLSDIVEAYEPIRLEFEKLSKDEQKQFRALKSTAADHYVDLLMASE